MSEQRAPSVPSSRAVVPPQGPGRVPSRVEPVPGTPFGLAIFGAPPATSGPAIGALVAGIAAVLVSLLVACVGLAAAAAATEGEAGSWGALVGGAFAVLTGFLGFAGVGLGIVGVRRTRQSAQPAGGGAVRGRGMATTGIVCGAVGVAIAACAIGVALLVALD